MGFESRRPHYRQLHKTDWIFILQKIRSNRRLRRMAVLAMIAVLAIIIALIAILAPLIINLVKGINQSGFQGILNELQGLIDKILNLLPAK